MNVIEINKRLAEIKAEIETKGDQITPEEVAAFEAELQSLSEQKSKIRATVEERNALLEKLAQDESIESKSTMQTKSTETDIFDSLNYRNAFMEYVCRGTQIPEEYRAPTPPALGPTITTTSDASAVIPTTIMREIIKKAESYGSLYRDVRRLNIQGGVSIPISTLRPVATWIDENTVSPTQRLEVKDSVLFHYYGLECRISQTLLASVVTLEEFQRLFVPLAVEAMIKAIEIGIIRGSGNNSMLGVINDPRIKDDQKITMTKKEISSWDGWMSKVFAKMKKSYRNGIFIMAQGTFDANINGMVDTTGQPIGRVNFGIDGGETYRFGGRRVETVEDELLPNFQDAKKGEEVAIFMRLNDYVINTNMQMYIHKWRDHDLNRLHNKCIMILDGKGADLNGTLIIKKGE